MLPRHFFHCFCLFNRGSSAPPFQELHGSHFRSLACATSSGSLLVPVLSQTTPDRVHPKCRKTLPLHLHTEFFFSYPHAHSVFMFYRTYVRSMCIYFFFLFFFGAGETYIFSSGLFFCLFAPSSSLSSQSRFCFGFELLSFFRLKAMCHSLLLSLCLFLHLFLPLPPTQSFHLIPLCSSSLLHVTLCALGAPCFGVVTYGLLRTCLRITATNHVQFISSTTENNCWTFAHTETLLQHVFMHCS